MNRWPKYLVLLVFTGAVTAEAQQLRGVVRDSATGEAVAGAVVSMLDQSGAALTRTITSTHGQYEVDWHDRAAWLRVVRIGFRPREIRLERGIVDDSTLDVVLVRLPTLLEAMHVTALGTCDRRRDNAQAQALLQQARAALLATIVAREANPAKVVRLAYERTVTRNLDAEAPSVRIDSATQGTASYKSVRRGADLVSRGFTTDSLGTGIYFSPNAEVLLDEGFAAGYCFRIAEASRARRNQVGLVFLPAAPKQVGRVDVEGVLWIDTTARALRDLEYRFVGLGRESEALGVGGSLTYQEMPNGVVIVSHWSLRLLKDRVESSSKLALSDGGGFVASAAWADGTTWVAPLGAAEVTALSDDGKKVAGATVRLRNTNYVAITDSRGVATFRHLIPGHYVAEVVSGDAPVVKQAAGPNVRQADSTLIRSAHVVPDVGDRLTSSAFRVRGGATTRHVTSVQASLLASSGRR